VTQPDEAMDVLKEKASQLNVSTLFHVLTSISKSDKIVQVSSCTDKNVKVWSSV